MGVYQYKCCHGIITTIYILRLYGTDLFTCLSLELYFYLVLILPVCSLSSSYVFLFVCSSVCDLSASQ